ncbi:MAG: transglycosylase SLT domain-containing protein [candidate division NC10 bacterium]|nr:transglycosylase SLT domain-containing protein [candidate division NC10 bacterium]
MGKASRLLWGPLLVALLPGYAAAGDGQIYRRMDASGMVHYTNVPPNPVLSRRFPRSEQSSGLKALISSAAHRVGLDPRLIEAVISVESDFDPLAVSRKGAMGLMQLMPETADRYAVQNPFDPRENIGGGTRYLRDLLHRFGGDLRWALAAYNAGERAVDTYKGIPPYRETREYVTKVLQRYGQPSISISRHASSSVGYRFFNPDGGSSFTNIPPRISLP